MMKENLIELYEQSFRDNRELPALSDYFKKEHFSYFEMAQEIAKLHLFFEKAGIQKGDRIALIGRNNPRWCMLYLATLTYGAVIVPILQDFNANDMQHIVNHSGSRLLFVGDIFWDSIDTDSIERIMAIVSLTDYSCIYERSGSELSSFLKNSSRHFRDRYPEGFTTDDIRYPRVENDEVAVINYTSGTTGFSKGVILTINNLTGNVAFCLWHKLHYRGSRVLSFLPLAHAFGGAIDFLLPLAAGSHITLLGRMPSPKVLFEALVEVRPTRTCTVPLIVEKVVRKQVKPMLESAAEQQGIPLEELDPAFLEQVKKKLHAAFGGAVLEVIIGGAPLNSEVEYLLRLIKFPFTVGYGLTECAPLVSYVGFEKFVPTSCGQVLPGVMTAKINSPDPLNIPGEILVKGENVMKGYYKNPQATADIFDEEGWLRTGDIGTMDADNMLFIRGRSKSMLLGPSGQNIYPEAIESKLNNLPCVMESLVLMRDGKLVALVYPDYEQADADGDIEQIMNENLALLNRRVAPYERVSAITLFPNEFEKTPKKSIKRYLYNV